MGVFHCADESSTDPPEEVPPTDPLTCPIVPGKETYIEIEKGRTGLGLSIVGGCDTLLVSIHPFMLLHCWHLFLFQQYFNNPPPPTWIKFRALVRLCVTAYLSEYACREQILIFVVMLRLQDIDSVIHWLTRLLLCVLFDRVPSSSMKCILTEQQREMDDCGQGIKYWRSAYVIVLCPHLWPPLTSCVKCKPLHFSSSLWQSF